jgi:hypothetical protein
MRLGAVEMLGCKPGEVMLTAAHNADLRAGQALGVAWKESKVQKEK